MSNFSLPELLQNEYVRMRQLRVDDFEQLCQAASDPLIWEQHPNPDRYKRDVFAKYFEGAMNSGGAFLVENANTHEVIGCTRYYDFDAEDSSVCIGYTFVIRVCWGLPFNKSMKLLMMDHAFKFVNKVYFHIGENNIRSQKAIAKLGAIRIGEKPMSYYGEEAHNNYVYSITRQDWDGRKVISHRS